MAGDLPGKPGFKFSFLPSQPFEKAAHESCARPSWRGRLCGGAGLPKAEIVNRAEDQDGAACTPQVLRGRWGVGVCPEGPSHHLCRDGLSPATRGGPSSHVPTYRSSSTPVPGPHRTLLRPTPGEVCRSTALLPHPQRHVHLTPWNQYALPYMARRERTLQPALQPDSGDGVSPL